MVRRYTDSEYIFTPGASGVGTVRLPNETTVELGGFALIVNVTDGIIIFNPRDPTKVGTVATDILTLTFDTSGMNAADDLLVVYDDPAYTANTTGLATEITTAAILAKLLASIAVTGTVTANAGTNLNTSALALDSTLVSGVNAILSALGSILTGPLNVNGSAVTVSGSVTANAGTNLNTSALGLEATLQLIKTATEAVAAIIAGGALTISGQVTANAGTNLNTSALALEATMQSILTGITAIKTAVELLDNTVSGNELQVDVITLPALPAGTNNIGDVDVLSLPALPAGTNNIGDVDVLSQPARVATTDSISSKDSTDVIQNGLVALTPKFKEIDAATSGDNTILAAVTSKKIRVVSLYLVASAAVTVRFESGASGTALSGQMQLAANGGFVLPYNPVGWFETASGVLLNLELSGAISVDGGFTYIEV